MAKATFNYDRAAQLLADAALYGDVKALQRSGMTRQTLHRYRQRLADDDVLLQIFTEKKALLEREWANELAPAIRNGIEFLSRAAQTADASDPDAIHAVAGAVKILTGVSFTKDVLSARISERTGQVREATKQDAAAEPTKLPN